MTPRHNSMKTYYDTASQIRLTHLPENFCASTITCHSTTAKQVDKLIDHIDHQATTFSLQSPSHHNSPPQHLINEMLEKRITALQQSLSHNASSSHNTTEYALKKDTNAKTNPL